MAASTPSSPNTPPAVWRPLRLALALCCLVPHAAGSSVPALDAAHAAKAGEPGRHLRGPQIEDIEDPIVDKETDLRMTTIGEEEREASEKAVWNGVQVECPKLVAPMLMLGNLVMICWVVHWTRRDANSRKKAEDQLREAIEEVCPATTAVPDSEPQTCSVCLCDIEPEEKMRKLQCGHCYHAQCISSWFLQDRNKPKVDCPLCRRRQRGLTKHLKALSRSKVYERQHNEDLNMMLEAMGTARRDNAATAFAMGPSLSNVSTEAPSEDAQASNEDEEAPQAEVEEEESWSGADADDAAASPTSRERHADASYECDVPVVLVVTV